VTPAAAPLSDAQLAELIDSDLSSLGPMSIGQPSAGALVNGLRMPTGEHWQLVDPGATWATQETIDYLITAIEAVHARFPDTQKLRIGHISAKKGGHLKPHKSHQSGRDVDTSYYYKKNRRFRWYRRANAGNLDRARTWAFVRALITDTDVEMILINSSVQKLLKEHALSIGEDPKWLDSVFQVGSRGHYPLIRHVRGHDTHIHIRYFNPVAQELGRRAYVTLVKRKIITPRHNLKRYKVRKGDLLGRLATRFGTTVRAIQQANGLRSTHIRAGKVYLIPRPGQVRAPAVVAVPGRRLPPPVNGARSRGLSAPADGGT